MDNPNNRTITKVEVEDILNYFENIGDNGERLTVTNLDNFQRAFVHESYYQSVQNYLVAGGQEGEQETYINYIPVESNERLEYLGDHILKAVVGRYLFERFGQEREGFMTKLKIKIERCSMLHKFGLNLGFKKFLLLSLQVENQTLLEKDRGRNTPSYFEDAFEAFIGSIVLEYGEKGYIYADRFVRGVIENVIDFSELISKNDNFKDSLQRFFQSYKWKTPVYIGLGEDGPLYRKVFTRVLTIKEEQASLLTPAIKQTIQTYTASCLREYKRTNPSAFNILFESCVKNGNYILGIGFGRRVTAAEQECAKQCMLNLDLDLNY